MAFVRPIALIGPMGSSKSATARRLGKLYNMRVFDVDREFEKRYGAIDAFFREHGEQEFRKKEAELIKQAPAYKNTVISTGGGAVLSEIGMSALLESCDIVYLYADIPTLKQRIAQSSRPLKNSLEEVFEARRPLYEKYSDFAIDTTGMTISETAEAVNIAVTGGRPNRYDVALIDADATLLDFEGAEEESISELLSFYGVTPDKELLRAYHIINNDYWQKFSLGEIGYEELRIARFDDYKKIVKIDVPSNVLNERFMETISNIDATIDGATAMLKNLRVRSVKTYVITNGARGSGKRMSKIAPLVSKIFYSTEIGFAKPDTNFFQAVFDKIGNPDKSRVIVLGDNEVTDIGGGIAFGIDTCLYAPNGVDETRARFTVKNHFEFLNIV